MERFLGALLLTLSSASAQYCVPSGCTSGTLDYGYVSAPTDGDHFYVGGMFNVHEPGDSSYSCGPVRKQGVETLEAFLWTIRHFRETYDILNDIAVGALGFDSCGRPEKALQQFLNLETCVVGYGDYPVEPRLLLGYVGAVEEDVSLLMAEVTSGMRKTLVSHGATSPALSDGAAYPYFLRTVPSILEQVDILFDSLLVLGWNYTQIVYSEEEYGVEMRDRFFSLADSQGICVVQAHSISASSQSGDYLNLVEELVANSATRAVILFTPSAIIREILSAADMAGARGVFTWMAPTAWGADEDLVDGLEDVAEGAFTMLYEQSAPSFDVFQDYIAQLTPAMVEDNPWFKEYWMDTFECSLPGQTTSYTESCNTDVQRLDPDNLDPLVPYVIKATYALLLGIENARSSQCSGSTLCSDFINHVNRWDIIHEHVRLLNTSGIAYFHQSTGDPLTTTYNLLNFRAPDASCTSHCYTEVGVYEAAARRLELTAPVYFYDETGVRFTQATSGCTANPCTVCGEVGPGPDSTTPSLGGNQGPDTEIVENIVMMRGDMWAMVLLILAALGVLLVLAFEIYLLTQICGSNYLANWRSMWLGQVLLLAVLISYLTLFAFIPTPSVISCSILRVAIGGSYAMIFSVLLVKLMIILSSKSYGSLQGIFQFLMFCFAWGMQIVIDVEWLILRPPGAIHDSERGWMCNVQFLDHVQSLIYVMFLIIMTTLIAIKTHGIFTNFREGVFIGLTAGFTIPIFIAWVLLGIFSPNPDFEAPAMAYGLFLTATLVLLIMFLPKVRQLNSLGMEGHYKEDGHTSVGVPSIRGMGSGLDGGSALGGSVILYGPPSVRSRPNSGGHFSNGSLILSGSNNYAQFSNDQSALYLRHPGSSGSNIASSVKSMPITIQARRPEQNSQGAASRILRVTGDLSGRSYASVSGRAPPEHAPIPKFHTNRSNKSNRSSAEVPRSYTDMGSL